MSRSRRAAEVLSTDCEDRQLGLAELCARSAYLNRAEDILVIRVAEMCSYADYFVIATASNSQQLRAIALDVEATMKANHVPKFGGEGRILGKWCLLDYGETLIHIFEPEARQYYQLEELWSDAPRIKWKEPTGMPLAELEEPPLWASGSFDDEEA